MIFYGYHLGVTFLCIANSIFCGVTVHSCESTYFISATTESKCEELCDNCRVEW